MNDTTITAKAKKRELIIFLLCLVTAALINAYAIITYDTNWSEMYTMIGMVTAIGIFLYIVQWIIRLLVRGIVGGVRKIAGN